jgi:hypothetical protein
MVVEGADGDAFVRSCASAVREHAEAKDRRLLELAPVRINISPHRLVDRRRLPGRHLLAAPRQEDGAALPPRPGEQAQSMAWRRVQDCPRDQRLLPDHQFQNDQDRSQSPDGRVEVPRAHFRPKFNDLERISRLTYYDLSMPTSTCSAAEPRKGARRRRRVGDPQARS